jgi:uncharacterized protein (DUF305 family)
MNPLPQFAGPATALALAAFAFLPTLTSPASAAPAPRPDETDTRFMQDMVVHHAQALEMTALVPDRAASSEVHRLAERIEVSQQDEIALMRRWLERRGQAVPAVGGLDPGDDAADGDAGHADHDGRMGHRGHGPAGGAEAGPGMLTAAELARLESASGPAFDRLFLDYMIRHHEGALAMVAALLATDGAAQDPEVFRFAAHVESDQRVEIERMRALLAALLAGAPAAGAVGVAGAAGPGASPAGPDPRGGLAPGWLDAGTAARGLELVATRARPEGFYDPGNPGNGAFANTDLAFRGDLVVVGNYNGFQIYDVSDPSNPVLRTAVVCPGGQGDVSIRGDLLFMSVEEVRGRVDCGPQGVAEAVSPDRFRGVRIFDLSDVDRPRQVAAVQTCRGSHTHTLVPDPADDEHIYVYVSGITGVRPAAELDGCRLPGPEGEDLAESALFRIEVIRVPLDAPELAAVVSEPRIFADTETGDVAGLWPGGDHGPGTQRSAQTNHCHDITVYPELGLAAGACAGNGILLDITDPANPMRLHQVADPNFAYWHSATFNNQGTTVVFTDEWGGGGAARCRASDRPEWGANALYRVVDGELRHAGYYKLPAPQGETENCVAHNGSLIPVPGRDIMVQAWYQGGISVFDFTDPSDPVEIAFFDRGPISADALVLGGYWSAYWYNGHIYGSEIARGLDVLRLAPSAHLSRNEIEAALLVRFGELNPQSQPRHTWPASPVVARAYLDQLTRSGAVADELAARLTAELDGVDGMGADRAAALAALAGMASELDGQAGMAEAAGRGIDARRFRALADTLRAMAAAG